MVCATTGIAQAAIVGTARMNGCANSPGTGCQIAWSNAARDVLGVSVNLGAGVGTMPVQNFTLPIFGGNGAFSFRAVSVPAGVLAFDVSGQSEGDPGFASLGSSNSRQTGTVCYCTAARAFTIPSPYNPLLAVLPSHTALKSAGRPSST